MMFIHGHSVPLLGILLTLSTPFIHCTYGNLRGLVDDGEVAEPLDAEVERGMLRKISIDLDLDPSVDVPRGISILFLEVPTSYIYIVEREHRNTHKIGAILDNDIMVLNDDERNIERNVYFSIEKDGMKVVRISDVFETEDGMEAEITELMKLPGEPSYKPLVRLPLEIELTDIDESEEMEMTIISPTRSVYKLKDNLINRAYIATVRYAGCLVPALENDNIMGRDIILDSSQNNLRILVASYTRDGRRTHSMYKFLGDENGGRIMQE